MSQPSLPIAMLLSATVPWLQVCTHWTGWNKSSSAATPCRLIMPFNYVIEKFEAYWADFIDRESEDDGTGPPKGVYAELEATAYPALDTMLATHPVLFSTLVATQLQSEFAGFVLASPDDTRRGEPSYFVENISSVEVAEQTVVVNGTCVAFTKPDRT